MGVSPGEGGARLTRRVREKYRVYSEPNAHGRVLLPTPPGMKTLDGGGIACDLMAERPGTPAPTGRTGLRSAPPAGGGRTRACRRRDRGAVGPAAGTPIARKTQAAPAGPRFVSPP